MVTKSSKKQTDASVEEGTIYVRSDGQTFKTPKINAIEIQKILRNKYVTEGLDQMQMSVFRKGITVKVVDKDGKEDAALTTDINNMVITNHDVSLKFAVQRMWRDTMEWGCSLSNPVWEYVGPTWTLIKLNRLPPESFSQRGNTISTVYNQILPGVCVNDKTSEIEYWQKQSNGQIKQLTNIHLMVDARTGQLGGVPYILPIFPFVKMLNYAWQRQMGKVNMWGTGGAWFIKVTDPVGDDQAYAQKILKNQSSTNKYQLRQNMEVVNLGIGSDGSALETITELGMQMRRFWIPADLGKDGSGIGSNSAEYEKWISFIEGMHDYVIWSIHKLLYPWLDYNGYADKGYQIVVDIPSPEIDKSELWLKIAREGDQAKSITENEHRALLSQAGAGDILKPLDEAGIAAVRARAASANPNMFAAQLQKADVVTRAAAAGIANKAGARTFLQATLGLEEGEPDDGLDAGTTGALHRLASAAADLAQAGNVHVQASDEEGSWITINGSHILIKPGENVGQAFERTYGQKINPGENAGQAYNRITKTQPNPTEIHAPPNPKNNTKFDNYSSKISSIESTDHIRSKIDEGKYKYYGIRSLPDEKVELGGTPKNSYQWTIDTPEKSSQWTPQALSGASAIKITQGTLKSPLWHLKVYGGENIVLLGSNKAINGQDGDEIIMKGSKVLATFTR